MHSFTVLSTCPVSTSREESAKRKSDSAIERDADFIADKDRTTDVAGGGSAFGLRVPHPSALARPNGTAEPGRNCLPKVVVESIWLRHVEMESNRTALLRERVRSAHRAPGESRPVGGGGRAR